MRERRKREKKKLKEIKINSEKEFIDYCKHRAIEGDTDGRRNEDVKQYNIGHPIPGYEDSACLDLSQATSISPSILLETWIHLK